MPVRNKSHRVTSPRDQSDIFREQNERRGTSHQRGYGSRWQKYRKEFLASFPWCLVCEVESSVVDHIIPVIQTGDEHSGDKDPLFYARFNHQPLCRHHHDVKSRFDERVSKHRAFALALQSDEEYAWATEEQARDILLMRTRLWKTWIDLSYAVDGESRRLPGRSLTGE